MKRLIAKAGLVLAAVALAGCGSDTEYKHQSKTVATNAKLLFKGAFARKSSNRALPMFSQEALDSFLHSSPEPMSIVRIEEKSAQSMIRQIAENGRYKTFSTPDRISLTFKHGVLSGTRGIGGDLMSAELDDSIALIKSRRAGTSRRVNRYLVDDDVTQEIVFSCSVTIGPQMSVAYGAVRGSGQKVTETCQSDTLNVTNMYVVDAAGRVLQSKQWFGPNIGYGLVMPIRL